MTNSIKFAIFALAILTQGALSLAAAKPQAVTPGREFHFPRDHGSHREFKTEWWYFTGHLRTPAGREFGFQWTVFRIGFFPPAEDMPKAPSLWRAQEIYFSHLALSDLDGKKFYFSDGAARGSLGLAGSDSNDFKVWTPEAEGAVKNGIFHLSGRGAGFSFRLETPRPEEVILHGEKGYSPKSTEAGRASYYYSVPRMPVQGELQLGEQRFPVAGEAWMDHEFGSDQLAKEQTGWDWFGLPLGERAALMIYRLRESSGRDFLSGTYISEGGEIFPLKAGDILLQTGNHWKSPASGAEYPLVWEIKIPKHRLDLKARASFAEQELNTRRSTQVIYWEGSVEVKGKAGDREVNRRGYLEMTGYAGKPLSF